MTALSFKRIPTSGKLPRPELPRRNPRALRHRRQLRPHHVRIDRRLADPGAVAAVAAGDDVLAADEFRVAADPLRDELRMLDEIGLRLEHAWDQHLALGELHGLEDLPLVRVTRISGLEGDRARPSEEHDVD